MKKTVYKFWQNLSPTPAHMVLDKNVENYNQEEQKEILSLLPDFSGKHVLELASGIGRFTGHFAQLAKRVDTSDFNPTFLEKNKETHKHLQNITYTLADAKTLDYEENTFDFVFINWLFLYFEDCDLIPYLQKINLWLKPGGFLFLRESCFKDIRNYENKNYAAIYRFQFEYDEVLSNIFSITRWGMIESYIKYRGSSNQFYWLCQKK
ncbi:MAG: methyltransferase domain-containing protein [Chlamydiia bacterium]|nr:methyltransferase domain-containing protein [Chlamydiia bacterium]